LTSQTAVQAACPVQPLVVVVVVQQRQAVRTHTVVLLPFFVGMSTSIYIHMTQTALHGSSLPSLY
jgi:hypothetical protein